MKAKDLVAKHDPPCDVVNDDTGTYQLDGVCTTEQEVSRLHNQPWIDSASLGTRLAFPLVVLAPGYRAHLEDAHFGLRRRSFLAREAPARFDPS